VPYASVLLPAAQSLSQPLQIRVLVTSAAGAAAWAQTSAAVTWPTFTSSAQQRYISDAFIAQTRALVAANDTSEALALVGVLGTMLNAKAVAADGSSIDLAGRAALRGTLLGIVADAGAFASGAACEAAAAAVALLVAEAAAVSRNASSAALRALSAVAAAGGAVSDDAATHTGDALSSLVAASEIDAASSAFSTSASSASANASASAHSAAVLGGVVTVLEALAASLQASLPVPGLPPRGVASSRIALSAGFDTPAQASARVFTAPGTNASFDPLPAGALVAPAASLFLALKFDPWSSGAADADANADADATVADANATSGSGIGGGGVTVARLAFSAPPDAASGDGGGVGGAPVAVSRLRTPLTFTLDTPPSLLHAADVAAAGDGAARMTAQCRFWDGAAGAYSGAGCTALPNPAPPAALLNVFWDSGAVVDVPADLVMTWQVAGALAAGCSSTRIDCASGGSGGSGGVAAAAVFWEDAGGDASADSAPLITCGAATNATAASASAPPPAGLRVFTGATCALSRPDNAARCFWDASRQAFVGAGCVASTVTRCACTHLTDFRIEPAPAIHVATLSQLKTLKPAELVSNLRFLLAVVLALFLVMHAGVALALAQERTARATLLARLTAPQLGFCARMAEKCTDGCDADGDADEDVWTWTLSVSECEAAPLAGSAVALAAAIGIPFARLRCAIPEALLPSSGAAAALLRLHHADVDADAGACGAEECQAPQLDALRAVRVVGSDAHDVTSGSALAGAAAGAAALTRHDALLTEAAAAHADGDGDGDAADGTAAPDAGAESEEAARAAPGAAAAAAACGADDATAADDDVGDARAAPPPPPLSDETLVSTALLFALLSSRRLLPRAALAARQRAASRFFASAAAGGGLNDSPHGRFDTLTCRFRILLGASNMRAGAWMAKARLWRAVLLAQEDAGSDAGDGDGACDGMRVWWDASDSLAFALLAAPPPPPGASLPPQDRTLAARCVRCVLVPMLAAARCVPCFWSSSPLDAAPDAVESAAGSGAAAANADAAAARARRGAADEAAARRAAEKAAAAAAADIRIVDADADADADVPSYEECPLAFSAAAIRRSLPQALAARVASGALTSEAAAMRIWATALTVGALRALPFSWLFASPSAADASSSAGVTLPDAGDAWLAAQLPDDVAVEVAAAAATQLADWRNSHALRVASLRAHRAAPPAAAARRGGRGARGSHAARNSLNFPRARRRASGRAHLPSAALPPPLLRHRGAAHRGGVALLPALSFLLPRGARAAGMRTVTRRPARAVPRLHGAVRLPAQRVSSGGFECGWHPGRMALRRVPGPGQPARPPAGCADWARVLAAVEARPARGV
jgi:hypothetical protein